MTSTDLATFMPKRLFETTIGFEDILDRLGKINEHAGVRYPFYNIKKIDDDNYLIELAIAGFCKQDIDITLDDNILTIKGNIETADPTEYLYKGITTKGFVRQFQISDTVEVKNAAVLNGILRVYLENIVPTKKRTKKIDVVDEGARD